MIAISAADWVDPNWPWCWKCFFEQQKEMAARGYDCERTNDPRYIICKRDRASQ